MVSGQAAAQDSFSDPEKAIIIQLRAKCSIRHRSGRVGLHNQMECYKGGVISSQKGPALPGNAEIEECRC